MADAETLQKLLHEAGELAAGLKPAEVAGRARERVRAEAASGTGELQAMIELYEDADWVAPPSVRRHLGAALLYFGTPDALPEAARSAAAPDSLLRALRPRIEAELAAHERFAALRARLEKRKFEAPARERRLYAFRRKLRSGLQARS